MSFHGVLSVPSPSQFSGKPPHEPQSLSKLLPVLEFPTDYSINLFIVLKPPTSTIVGPSQLFPPFPVPNPCPPTPSSQCQPSSYIPLHSHLYVSRVLHPSYASASLLLLLLQFCCISLAIVNSLLATSILGFSFRRKLSPAVRL